MTEQHDRTCNMTECNMTELEDLSSSFNLWHMTFVGSWHMTFIGSWYMTFVRQTTHTFNLNRVIRSCSWSGWSSALLIFRTAATHTATLCNPLQQCALPFFISLKKIWMQICTFECRFVHLNADFVHLNADCVHLNADLYIWKQILYIWMQVFTFECRFCTFECRFFTKSAFQCKNLQIYLHSSVH